MIPARIALSLDRLLRSVRTALTGIPEEPAPVRLEMQHAIRLELLHAVNDAEQLVFMLGEEFDRLTPDARFASKASALVKATLGQPCEGSVDLHNALTCPYCAHRIGGHGTKGCMQPVESGGRYSCVNVPEQLCGCTKAWRL